MPTGYATRAAADVEGDHRATDRVAVADADAGTGAICYE
jgi:hypothetical protein